MRRGRAGHLPAVVVAVVLALASAGTISAQAGSPAATGGRRTALLDVGAAAGQEPDAVEMLALRRIFSTIGTAPDLLASADSLEDYDLVVTAGALTNARTNAGLSDRLFDFVEGGGVLVCAGETGSSLFPLFGVTGRTALRTRTRLAFAGQDPALALLAHPRLREISLGNGEPPFFKEVIWTHGAVLGPGAQALGRFEDSSVGFSVHPYGRGRAYLLGVSYTESVLLGQVGGTYNAERQYANGVEPSADAVILVLKGIWAEAGAPAVCLAPVPYARTTALVLTHDVDAQTSFVDSLKFAALEKRYGVSSTFFINTKDFTDEYDIGYFAVPENVRAVKQLAAQGFDIGSHTVAHSPRFAEAPEGDPAVTRRTYDPVKRLTVWGEVKVSREMLAAALDGRTPSSYRSGELAFPRSLVRVLQAAGYRADSTYSANATLSAFPFLAFEDQVVGARESKVVEVPVTLDDSQGFLTPATLSRAVQAWTEVLRAHALYGGTTVLLVHPSDTRTQGFKLQAQESLMKEAVALGAWMGDLSRMADFWAARASLRFGVETAADGALVVRLAARGADLDPAIGFEVSGFSGTVRVLDREGRQVAFAASTRAGRTYLAMPAREP